MSLNGERKEREIERALKERMRDREREDDRVREKGTKECPY